MLLVTYYTKFAGPIPPPLNLLLGPGRACAFAWARCRSLRAAGAPVHDAEPSAGAQEAGLREVPLGQERRDETRAYHAYVQQRNAREAAELAARVDAVQERVQGIELKQLEDREALDMHMERQAGELDWLKLQVLHVPRANGNRRGARREQARDKLHVVARSEVHKEYEGKRLPVPDWRVPWEVDWPSYEPVDFTHESVHEADSDPLDPGEVHAAHAPPSARAPVGGDCS